MTSYPHSLKKLAIINQIIKVVGTNQPIKYERLLSFLTMSEPFLNKTKAKEYLEGLLDINKIDINENNEVFLCPTKE